MGNVEKQTDWIKEEIRGLRFIDESHMESLRDLMIQTGLLDTTSPWFVPLYLASALPVAARRAIQRGGLDTTMLKAVSSDWPPDLRAVANLALALSPIPAKVDLHETFDALCGTPWFDIALCAVSLRWESLDQ